MNPVNYFYYKLKPVIPRRLQIAVRRLIARPKLKKFGHIWPIDPNSGTPPEGWPGWPEGKKFALVLSHDVDTQNGYDKVLKLAAIDAELGFKSSFNFAPEKYTNGKSLHNELRNKGFGIGVHGLKHDGKLFSSHHIFIERSHRINYFLKSWNTTSFTSPSMHHNLNWMHELNITNSISTFDTDPFEPQPDGVRTIFPFWVKNKIASHAFLELPYTLPQDHLLFIILKEKNIDIWKRKLDWIAENGGMALLNTHSDYMNFDGTELKNEEYPYEYYKNFLLFIRETYTDQFWHTTPSQIVTFYKEKLEEARNH